MRRYGAAQVCWRCWDIASGGDGTAPEPDPDEDLATLEDMHAEPMPEALDGYMRPYGAAAGARIVTLEEFAAVDEPGAAPIIGEPGSILIPEGGDVMFYGDGGAGKTTLSVDLAFHLATGRPWLGMPVPQPRRVLLIENEGPRALFRDKLRRKLEAWGASNGPAPGGRVLVFEQPWARVTFAEEEWRAKLAERITENEIDVLIAGPLVRLGMDVAGTMQEVRAFMSLVEDVRTRCGRLLTECLNHHENKGGAVSGAWEGAGDTLLHVQAAGNGHTVVFVQKARWDSGRHGTTVKLAWTDGEGFELEGDRNYVVEIEALLSDGQWRTDRHIAEPKDKGGIGANQTTVRSLLDGSPERFRSCSGKEIGKSPRGTFWQLRQGSDAPDAVSGFSGGAEEGAALRPALKGAAPDEHTPGDPAEGALDASEHPTQTGLDAELDRVAAKFPEMADEGAS